MCKIVNSETGGIYILKLACLFFFQDIKVELEIVQARNEVYLGFAFTLTIFNVSDPIFQFPLWWASFSLGAG